MPKIAVCVGPNDNGAVMALADFGNAEPIPGFLYELANGVIVVVDVPGDEHFAVVDFLRQAIAEYRANHAGEIYRVAGGAECKIVLSDSDTERHPDIAVYKSSPVSAKDRWSTWVPEIVVEVVSPGSEERDYEEKRSEYFAFGVQEYWIVDCYVQQILILKRWGQRWRENLLTAQDVYHTKLLPGFALNVLGVFSVVANKPERD